MPLVLTNGLLLLLALAQSPLLLQLELRMQAVLLPVVSAQGWAAGGVGPCSVLAGAAEAQAVTVLKIVLRPSMTASLLLPAAEEVKRWTAACCFSCDVNAQLCASRCSRSTVTVGWLLSFTLLPQVLDVRILSCSVATLLALLQCATS